ncbi:MAG: DUF5103 domain-containing protein [Saprospiraceae bacterium]|nr:DUF5103 domain-containing protein [Saprospiraceae bacterium]
MLNSRCVSFFYLIPVLLLFCLSAKAQDEALKYDDRVYVDNIHSVQFFVSGLVLSNPIINLRANTQLYFTFDDLDDQVKTYTYSFVHCNADWTPSNLTETEYINGFTESYIDQYEYSIGTATPFVHYYLSFPNRDFDFNISGNYLLKVYEDENEKRLVITRRFMVVEPIMVVAPQMVRTAMVSKSDSHQELDFAVFFPDVDVRSPQAEIKATVLQNGRWDNAIQGIEPRFARQKELFFDYQDKIVFEAGKEFRWADLRSFKYPDDLIYTVELYEDGYDVTLITDEKRLRSYYLDISDINGRFVIGTSDFRDRDLQSDYANVLFSLQSSTEYYESDVYLYGAMTEWRLQPRFKMVYNRQKEVYLTEVLLKQGFYDYEYVIVGKDGKPDISETEGSWFEANNEYTILIYYRPFGGRYDRLVASKTITSRS